MTKGICMTQSDTHDDEFWEKVKAGEVKVGCRLGHHHGTSYGVECDQCTADTIKLMSFKPDEGPWVASDDGHYIYSDDFTHDVSLKVCGDFWDSNQRKQYADHLARVLNTEIVLRSIDLHKGE